MRQSDCGFNWIVWVGVTRLPQLIDVGRLSVTYRYGLRAPVLCTIQEGVVRLKVICSNLLIHFCIPSLFKINEWIPSTGFNFEQFYCKFIYSFSDTDKYKCSSTSVLYLVSPSDEKCKYTSIGQVFWFFILIEIIFCSITLQYLNIFYCIYTNIELPISKDL
jgi:hypothetical protein